jgi:PelA/Pel-15E family pectate lyase
MRIKKPSEEIKQAVNSAMAWFERSKIEGYHLVSVEDPKNPAEKDKVLVAKPGSVIWARFYDIDTNEPFFSGRDGIKKKTIAEIDKERRVGYAWYGTWPAKLLENKYLAWLKKI